MKTYPWKRFWCPRGAVFHLSGHGYLTDPDAKHGRIHNPGLVTLAECHNIPCVVMLGEPGIGKSTEFTAEATRTRSEVAGGEDMVLHFNLNEFQTDSLLVKDIFENTEIRNWMKGTCCLYLFLDSLDEGVLEIRNIARVLAGQLRKFEGLKSRLRLRIACRTAEWPDTLESELNTLFGPDQVKVLELAPLRMDDVVNAAIVEAIPHPEFIAEIERVEVAAFAINPITLKQLFGIFKESNRLPKSKRDIYEHGCLLLCSEPNSNRHAAKRVGILSANQRLEIASRVAGYLVFCGHTAIDKRDIPHSLADRLSVSDLEGGTEGDQHNHDFPVTGSAVQEVLETPLFSGLGVNQLGFSHRTFAEFLAARYLLRRQLSFAQKSSLFFHQEQASKVVPQLAETAAWVAIGDSQFLEAVIRTDPQVLLRSDVSTAGEELRSRLFDRLVEEITTEETQQVFSDVRGHLDKLKHSNLASQLIAALNRHPTNTAVLRFVLTVCEVCREERLISEMIDISLDTSIDCRTRACAVYAASAIGSDNDLGKLRPLALERCEDDSYDELLGSALECLWPRKLITAEEVFSRLTEPRRRFFLGAYRYALKTSFIKAMTPKDMAIALQWCCEQIKKASIANDFVDLIQSIVKGAIPLLDDDDIREWFAEYVVAHYENSHFRLPDEIFEEMNRHSRLRIVEVVVTKASNLKELAQELIVRKPYWIRHEDMEWLMTKSSSAANKNERIVWAEVARIRFKYGGRPHADRVLVHCEMNGEIAAAFSDIFEAVVIGSPRALEMQAEIARYEETERRIKELELQEENISQSRPLDPSPASLMLLALDRLESGSLNQWTKVCGCLQHDEYGRYHDLVWTESLDTHPGWSTASETTRTRVKEAAKRYLEFHSKCSVDCVGSENIPSSMICAYVALILVLELDEGFLNELPGSSWAALAYTIFGFPMSSGLGGKAEDRHRTLVAIAYKNRPDEVIVALLKLIETENSKADQTELFSLRLVSKCWNTMLSEALLAKAKDGSLREDCLRSLLEELMANGCEGAVDFAQSLIKSRKRKKHRNLAKVGAVALWRQTKGSGWGTLWPTFQLDDHFFVEVLQEMVKGYWYQKRQVFDLSDHDLANLYACLTEKFPFANDPEDEGRICPKADFRDSALRALCARATFSACAEIDRLRQEFPHLSFLSNALHRTIRTTLESTWSPLPKESFRQLISRKKSRLVRNGQELQSIIVESLTRLQDRLHGETPAVRDIWDNSPEDKSWAPVDENALSDYITRHLRDDLNEFGIVPLREVEIRRGYVTSGERTDIYVSAAINGLEPGVFDRIHVVIEVKGCWNKDLQAAMKLQLRDRYLKDNSCRQGIYVIGWFCCDAWNKKDRRNRESPSWTIEEARDFFEKQERELSHSGAQLVSFVLDSRLNCRSATTGRS